MYDEQLENLIDAALADGVLTEKEKQILFKKAQSMGIDLDEFEMVLDARLVKLKKAEKAKESAPKSNKLGDVKKCPACGAVVQSFQGVCPECGYTFEGVEASDSVKKLAKALKGKGESYEKMASIIKRVTVPNSKADLIELITFIQAQMTSVEGIRAGEYWNACNSKLQECSMRVNLLFPNDVQLTTLITKVNENIKKIANKRGARKMFLVSGGSLLILLGFFVGWKIWFLDWPSFWRLITIMITSYSICVGGILMIIHNREIAGFLLPVAIVIPLILLCVFVGWKIWLLDWSVFWRIVTILGFVFILLPSCFYLFSHVLDFFDIF